jgi:TIR domain
MTGKQNRRRRYGFLLVAILGLIVVAGLIFLRSSQTGAPSSAAFTSTAASVSTALLTEISLGPTASPQPSATQSQTAAPLMTTTPDLLSTKSGGGGDAPTEIAPGQEDTATEPVPPSQPAFEVAAVPVKVVSESGITIGDGTLRVFAPANIEYPQTARVELELRLDNRYITPTPFGAQVTIIPVTPVTTTPLPGQPTATARLAIHETQGVEIFQRMGASLLCLPESFTGCDPTSDPTTARLIDVKGATWSWIVRPVEGTQGPQDLRLTLWTVQRVNDGPEQADVVWEHPFQIEVQSAGSGLNPAIIIGIGAAVLAAIVGAAYVWRRSTAGATSPAGQRTAVRRAKPTAFISYRRRAGWSIARTIHDRLTAQGADVFLDVDDINEGRFEEIIKKAIESREFFILVLAPGTVDSEWVLKEAAYALQHSRKIIPVLVEGFNLTDNPLPSALAGIQSHNAITLTPEYFNAGMERLAKFVGLAAE